MVEIQRVDHVGIRVSELNQAVAFYQVLGFSLISKSSNDAVAYVSWFILQNSRGLLGDDLPRGASAVRWNIAMAAAVTVTLVSVGYMLWTRE